MTRARQAGQGTLELLVAIPALMLVVALGWQVIAVAWTAVRAEEAARRAGLAAGGAPGRVVTVTRTTTVPGPLADGRSLTVHAAVVP